MHKISLPISRNSEREAERRIDGMRASVTIGSNKLIVEDVPASDASEAKGRAEPIARKFLDLLCSMDDFCAELDANTVEGESEDGKHTVMINSNATLRATLYITSQDTDGNVISDSRKPGVIPYEHIDAMAYFRSAKLSTNVFGSFRDFYLAAENAAALLHPGPQNKNLLGKALATVYQVKLNDLCVHASEAGVSCTTSDAVQKTTEFLWDTRRRAFHAAHEPLVVSNPADEEEVRKALPLVKAVARDMIRFAAEQQRANMLAPAGPTSSPP
jgi:hypothetical protein